MQPFDGPFGCDVIMKKSANRCDVGHLAIRQLDGTPHHAHNDVMCIVHFFGVYTFIHKKIVTVITSHLIENTL